MTLVSLILTAYGLGLVVGAVASLVRKGVNNS